MKKGKIIRTVFTVTVLSTEPIKGLPLDHILEQCDDGQGDIKMSLVDEPTIKEKIFHGKTAVNQLRKSGLDPEDFDLYENGDDVSSVG